MDYSNLIKNYCNVSACANYHLQTTATWPLHTGLTEKDSELKSNNLLNFLLKLKCVLVFCFVFAFVGHLVLHSGTLSYRRLFCPTFSTIFSICVFRTYSNLMEQSKVHRSKGRALFIVYFIPPIISLTIQ